MDRLVLTEYNANVSDLVSQSHGVTGFQCPGQDTVKAHSTQSQVKAADHRKQYSVNPHETCKPIKHFEGRYLAPEPPTRLKPSASEPSSSRRTPGRRHIARDRQTQLNNSRTPSLICASLGLDPRQHGCRPGTTWNAYSGNGLHYIAQLHISSGCQIIGVPP